MFSRDDLSTCVLRPGVAGVAGGPAERLDQPGPPVTERRVGEKPGDPPVKDTSGEGVLSYAHSLLVVEREARELLRPRVPGVP